MEDMGVEESVANEIVAILNECFVATITEVKHDDALDNMNMEGEKGYRVNATGVSNVILYMKPDNTVNLVRWADNDLYADGEYVDTVVKIRNRPDLEVLSYTTETQGYIRYVTGEVRNNAKRKYGYIQIEINLYSGGALVGSTLDNVNNLGTGDIWKFKAPIFETNADQYKIINVSGF